MKYDPDAVFCESQDFCRKFDPLNSFFLRRGSYHFKPKIWQHSIFFSLFWTKIRGPWKFVFVIYISWRFLKTLIVKLEWPQISKSTRFKMIWSSLFENKIIQCIAAKFLYKSPDHPKKTAFLSNLNLGTCPYKFDSRNLKIKPKSQPKFSFWMRLKIVQNVLIYSSDFRISIGVR